MGGIGRIHDGDEFVSRVNGKFVPHVSERLEKRRYSLSLLDGTVKDCIYDGRVGGKYCFTTRETKDEWKYNFFREGEFKVDDTIIGVLVNPQEVTINRGVEPIEFIQVQQAWDIARGRE